MDIIRLDGTPSKIKGKYIPYLHCSSSFEGASRIFFYNAVIRSFSSHCFTSAFTSADVIFHNFLELHSAYLKEDFFVNVPFINRFTPPPRPHHHPSIPLNGQNLLRMTCLCSQQAWNCHAWHVQLDFTAQNIKQRGDLMELNFEGLKMQRWNVPLV